MQLGLTRVRRRAGLQLATLALTASSACSKETPNNPPPPDQNSLGSAEVSGVRAVGRNLSIPLDATPSPDGKKTYFVARKADGTGALFAIEASGGEPTELAADFAAPVSVVMSTDGATAYVADLGAGEASAAEGRGKIFAVTGGVKSELASAAGHQARGLDLIRMNGADVLYFTGNDPTSGAPGVFSLSIGGAVATVYSGPALRDPSGVAAIANGEVFVSDPGIGAVLRIREGIATELASGLALGYPAGIALSEDQKFLLVSAIRPAERTAVVHRIDLLSGDSGEFSDGISENSESAGLHRAHGADLFAWADAGAPGTVYLVGTKKSPLP